MKPAVLGGIDMSFRYLAAATLLACTTAFAAEDRPPGEPAVTGGAQPVQPAVKEAAPPTLTVSIRMPAEPKVVYRGLANFDNAGAGAFGMLYPAPNIAGLVVAVLTHAAISEGAQAQQRKQIQDSADQVLTPFRPTLDSFTQSDLIARAVQIPAAPGTRKLIDGAEPAAPAMSVEPASVFSMTQDQRALVLDVVVTVARREGASAEPTKRAVRVVSNPKDGEDLVAFWTANDGEKLRHESALLLAQALDLAVADASSRGASAGKPERTFRYLEGGTEKMERAQLVEQLCERAVIRTLRGELMSVPLRRSLTTSSVGCEGARP